MRYDDLDDDTLRKAEAECLSRPSNSAMWDDRLYTTHGPVLAWAERGDDVLAESNYLMVLDALQATAANTEHESDCCWDEDGRKRGWGTTESPHDDDVIDATISDWLVGSLRQIFVRVRNEHCTYCSATADSEEECDPSNESGEHVFAFTPTFREAVSISLALQDYPVYDESDFSEREWEAAEDSLNMALDDAEMHYNRDNDEDISDELDAEVRDAVRNDPEGVVQNYMPEVMWDDIVREYAEHAERIAGLALETYARSLIPTQPESLFD